MDNWKRQPGGYIMPSPEVQVSCFFDACLSHGQGQPADLINWGWAWYKRESGMIAFCKRCRKTKGGIIMKLVQQHANPTSTRRRGRKQRKKNQAGRLDNGQPNADH